MSTTRLKLTHDGDMGAPFFRVGMGGFICLLGLNEQFKPKIPDDAPCIYLCTSPRPLASKADADFWLTGTFPHVEADNDAANELDSLIQNYLRERWVAGDRVAWIEYEEAL